MSDRFERVQSSGSVRTEVRREESEERQAVTTFEVSEVDGREDTAAVLSSFSVLI